MRASSSKRRPDLLPWRPRCAAWLLSALALCGCATDQSAPGTLARFDGGEITVDELERALLSLPPAARGADPEARHELYGSLLEQLAVRELLIAEGRSRDLLTIPEVADQWEEARKQILASTFLQSEIEVPQATLEQARAFFEENRTSFDRPERREVYHLFLRPEAGESVDLLRRRLERLRERALAGEPFPMLAREHSQSQLRSGDGALGWVQPGQLAPNLNDIVFSLEEGVPSEVMMTRSGGHLLFAARVVEAEAATAEEALPIARRQVQQQLQSEAVSAYLAKQEAAPEDFVPGVEELRALIAGGDPNAVVLRVADLTLTAEELIARLQAAAGRGGADEAERASALLDSIAQRERLVLRAEKAGTAGEPQVAEALARAEENVIFATMQRRLLLDRIDGDPETLERFFDRERRRFSGPLRLRYERLTAPLGRESGSVMAQMERSLEALRSGQMTLAEVAAEVGANVEEPVWKSLERLLEEGGGGRRRLAGLAAGDYSRPASNGREIELFHVLERSLPEEPQLDAVRDEVREAYLLAHGEKLYEELVAETLRASRFEVLAENVERFLRDASGVERPAPAG